jgi:hypothetical protein
MADSFTEVREWIEALARLSKEHTGSGYELEWREINHRQLGRNKIPVAAIFPEAADGLRCLGKIREAQLFRELTQTILANFPELLPWLTAKPLQVLAHAGEWPKIIRILALLRATPRPGIYLRQLDVAGMDSKFIEQHKKLLAELLDMVLPATAIKQEASGGAGFAERYGFLEKPVHIRFRLLDPHLFIHGLSVRQIVITENMVNGLAFPPLPHAMVIFGLGYGLDRLAGCHWLRDKTITYWGDLDTHGFVMLDQIRSYFPQTRSLLMDKDTLLTHRDQWGRETSPTNRELLRLSAAEASLYDDFRNNRYADTLRLEQEKISFTFVQAALAALE